MNKPYRRGDFRVIKRPVFGYQVQVKDRHDDWHDLGCSFDYLGNARLRVRNLHAACCIMADLTKPEHWDAAKHDLTSKAKYFKAP